jgi:translation initiation factor IF-1
MNTPQAEYLSISATKCRDESGRIVLKAKVHGGGYIYASIGLNKGCVILARKLVGQYVLATVRVDGVVIGFVARVKLRSRTSISIAIPRKFRRMFNRGDVVVIRLRPIGDGHGY